MLSAVGSGPPHLLYNMHAPESSNFIVMLVLYRSLCRLHMFHILSWKWDQRKVAPWTFLHCNGDSICVGYDLILDSLNVLSVHICLIVLN